MNKISVSLFKIAGIILITYGLSQTAKLYASIQSMPTESNHHIPFSLYYSHFLPIVIGAAIWFFSEKLAGGDDARERITQQSALSVGVFLLGIYFVACYLPELISLYVQYRELKRLSPVGETFANDKLPGIRLAGLRAFAGSLLMIFSVKISNLFAAIRRFGN